MLKLSKFFELNDVLSLKHDLLLYFSVSECYFVFIIINQGPSHSSSSIFVSEIKYMSILYHVLSNFPLNLPNSKFELSSGQIGHDIPSFQAFLLRLYCISINFNVCSNLWVPGIQNQICNSSLSPLVGKLFQIRIHDQLDAHSIYYVFHHAQSRFEIFKESGKLV